MRCIENSRPCGGERENNAAAATDRHRKPSTPCMTMGLTRSGCDMTASGLKPETLPFDNRLM
jgi:hypothetical protein